MKAVLKKLIGISSLVLLLTGCSSVSELFDGKTQTRLEGERISVLRLQKDLEPDPASSSEPITLPESWNNPAWPQGGGYPSHAMGHLGLGANLTEAWSVDIGAGGSAKLPLITQPVVAGSFVFAMDTEAVLSAYDSATGNKRWSRALAPEAEDETDSLGGGIAYSNGRLYVTTGYKDLIALDPVTGKDLWRKVTPAPSRSSPAVMDGRVFIVTIDNRIVAYSESDGTVLWNYAGASETTNLLSSPSPALDLNSVIVAFSSGQLYAFHAENGQTIWMDNLASVRHLGALGSISDIRGLPVVDRGMIYAVSFGGRMVAIDERTGMRVWQREIGGAETPWAAGDTVFLITADQQLAALDRDTGGIRWVTRLAAFENPEKRKNAIIWTGPVLAGGRLIVASNRSTVMEIDPLTGKTMSTWDASGSIAVAPVVADGALYLLAKSGELTAYRAK